MKFRDSITSTLYNYRTMECNWNKTWTPVSTLDTCVFYQCINPPLVSNFLHPKFKPFFYFHVFDTVFSALEVCCIQMSKVKHIERPCAMYKFS